MYIAPLDVRLFYEKDESDDTVVQPDIIVICDKNKIGEEGCRGAPDLVIKILSPSNTAIEMERKLKLYQNAGVREYWIVDPENKGVTVYRFQEPRPSPKGEGSPLEGAIFHTYKSADKVQVAIFPDLNIMLEQVFAG